MKRVKLLSIVLSVVLVLGVSMVTMAADNDSVDVNYSITAINEIEISAGPVVLAITTATAGSDPDDATDATETYAITTNCAADGKMITAILDSAMPLGVTLKLTMTAPTGADAGTQVTLTDSAVNAITNIDAVSEANLGTSFVMSATAEAGIVSGTRTVTLTVVDDV